MHLARCRRPALVHDSLLRASAHRVRSSDKAKEYARGSGTRCGSAQRQCGCLALMAAKYSERVLPAPDLTKVAHRRGEQAGIDAVSFAFELAPFMRHESDIPQLTAHRSWSHACDCTQQLLTTGGSRASPSRARAGSQITTLTHKQWLHAAARSAEGRLAFAASGQG